MMFFRLDFLRLVLLTLLITLLQPTAALAQSRRANTGDYDDFNSFVADPTELDEEFSQIFGRFFQTQLGVGTGIFTGGLGEAYPAGVLLGLKFIYYFDKTLGAELGVGYAHSAGHYVTDDGAATPKAINLDRSITLIPVNAGLRYGFNRDTLARGFALMNPYISANALVVFRSEETTADNGSPGLDPTLIDSFGVNSVFNSTAFGFDFGGGIAFDVYKDKLFLGLDLRYQLLFFSDSNVLVGQIPRSGNFISILGTLTYNY